MTEISSNTPGVKALLRNINAQAKLSNRMAGLSQKQNELEQKILGDEIPGWDGLGEDLVESVAVSTMDGGKMELEELVRILNAARERIE